MKKYALLLLIPVILLSGALCASGCRAVLVPADEGIEPGERETREFELEGFTDVSISGAFRYEISYAESFSVSVSTGANLFKYLDVTKSGQTLVIDVNYSGGIRINSRPEAVITMPRITGLRSTGATDGILSGFKSEGDLDISLDGACEVKLSEMVAVNVLLELSGASRITGVILVDTMEIDVNSASKVGLEGSTGNLTVEGSGASRVELLDLISQNADITFRDASQGTVNLYGNLDARLSGASTLEYTGTPTIGILDISGASTIRKK